MGKRLECIAPIRTPSSLQLIAGRMGNLDLPRYYHSTVDNVDIMNRELIQRGGFPQQERMIRDKRKSLDKATLYSYQAALIRKALKVHDEDFPIVRALINPNKLKQDYDDKILSVGFEHGFKPGDVFEWHRTHSYWLIYLQDLDEIAYFRGEIRRCDHTISWLDEEGNEHFTFAAVRGPVETKIDSIQKHQIIIDNPNYSLDILMPRNEDTMHYFKRYAKFYLQTADSPDDKICWRVEATDSISTDGILEVVAVEYYSNQDEDDVEAGLVGAKIERLVEPEVDVKTEIIGNTFIKCKKEYTYYVETKQKGDWYVKGTNVPVVLNASFTERGIPQVVLKWNTTYSGQFELYYGNEKGPYDNFIKTIVVESLF